MSVEIHGLFGAAKRGKTDSLKKFICLLKKSGFKLIESDSVDFGYDGQWHLNRGKVSIVITTSGDCGDTEMSNAEYFERILASCNISSEDGKLLWFTASRTKGDTASFLNNYAAGHNYELVWIAKPYWYAPGYRFANKMFELMNNQTAEMLLTLVEEETNEK